jgi:hypothetical protein
LSISLDTPTLVAIGVGAVQTIILVIAGFVAWFQLRETAKTRYLEAIVRVFEEFGSEEAYHYADLVLGLPTRVEEYTPAEVELATWVVRVYEKIGFLVESGMIPANYIIPLYSRRIVWTWTAVQPYVAWQIALKQSGGLYRLAGDAHNFKRLHNRAIAYRKGVKSREQVDPPIPAEYRQRLLNAIQRGERVYPAIEAAGLS